MTTRIQIGNLTLDQPYYLDGNGVAWSLETTTGIYDSAPVRTNYTPRPLAWGDYDGPVYPDKRVITIKGKVVTTSEFQRKTAIRQCKAVLADGSLSNLNVIDELGTMYAPVRMSSPTTTSMVGQAGFDFSMQFTAADPRLLGAVGFDVTSMAQSSGQGIPWRGSTGSSGIQWRGSNGQAGVMWLTGGLTSSGVLTLDNTSGTARADILFTITGPCLNPKLFTATDRIAYTGALGVGDVLTINTGTGAVLLNGVTRRSYLSRAEFFTVPAGQILDVIFACDVQNNVATCTGQFNVSYL